MDQSTITAIATPYGHGGIGVLRISGPRAFSIGASVFQRKRFPVRTEPGADLLDYDSHRFYYGHIVDNGAVIDEVLTVFMRAPATYTREDVVEIHSHSGPYVLRAVLDLVLKAGAEIAQPGEFTKRAFLNGRIDLTQAEAVIDIINARTGAALSMATNQLGGRLTTTLETVKAGLLEIQTAVEAAIDFPEEIGDILDVEKTRALLADVVLPQIATLLDNYKKGQVLKDGIKMVIIGAPNVGKSSLMNRLVEEERSIVTAIPGTTRDLIEDRFSVGGFPVVVTDTAGIHDTTDPIEQIGIERAQGCADRSDLILFLLDGSRPPVGSEIRHCESLGSKPVILVVNKIDLTDFKMPVLPPALANTASVPVSAKENVGMDGLRRAIEAVCRDLTGGGVQLHLVPSRRHKALLEAIQGSVLDLLAGIVARMTPELLAVDLGAALDGINEILGVRVSGDVLDRVFEDFCVGK